MVDFISHALIGGIISIFAKLNKKETWIVVFFSFLPDIIHSILYFYVGFLSGRPFFIPQTGDWVGFRESSPIAVLLNDVPHSIFFLLLVIVPLVLYFKLPKMAIAGYFSHIVFDLVSHTGEWSLRPFYPFSLAVSGFSDVWTWPVFSLSILWIYIMLSTILYYSLVESF